MKQIILISLITVLILGCSTKEKNQKATAENSDVQEESSLKELPINTLSPEEIAEGWELLFDGSSSDQWRGYTKESFPESGWYIKDGTLAVEYSGNEEAGGAGDIITIERFENFEFSVDFLVTTEGNSGILYRVIEKEGTPIWHNAPEFQLIDDQTYIDQGEYDMNKHLTGDNYDLHSSSVKPSNPVGEWNTARSTAIRRSSSVISRSTSGKRICRRFPTSSGPNGRWSWTFRKWMLTSSRFFFLIHDV